MDSRGDGDELHQQVGDGVADAAAYLTDNVGHRISDNQNSLRAGARGPTLLEDFALREKIFHFDHERIPERIVHARGSGAHGVFECTRAIPELTKASIFQKERSEEHTSELQSLMRISYAVFCLKKKRNDKSTSQH